MSDIAKLTVALYANSVQFSSELQKAQKKAEHWSVSVGKSFNLAAKYAAAGAVATTAALTLIYNKQSDVIDQTAKFADRIGISTEELTRLQHAAELTGLGTDKMNMSLQRMTRRIAEAAVGAGEARPALIALGLDAQKMGEMTPDEQLRVLADALKNVESHSEKVRIAFKLFDSEGVGMVNMLAGGSAALNDMAAEADALGVTLSRVDASKVEMANDALFKISQSSKAIQQSFTSELAPLITALADEYTKLSTKVGSGSTFMADSIYVVVKGASYLGTTFRGVEVIVHGLLVAFEGLKTGALLTMQDIITGAYNVGEAIIKSIVYPIQQMLDGLGNFSDSAEDMAKSLAEITTLDPLVLYSQKDFEQDQLRFKFALEGLHDLMTQPVPSDSVDAWYAKVKETAQKAAEELAAGVTSNQPGTIPDQTNKKTTAIDSFRKETQLLQTEAMRRATIMSDQQNKAMYEESFRYQDQSNKLAEQFNQAYEQAAGNHQLMSELDSAHFDSQERLTKIHQENLTQIEKDELEKRKQYNDSMAQSMLTFTTQQMNITTSALKTAGQENSGLYKVLFAAQKAAAIPSMVIATEQAALNAAAWLPGPPGLMMAAAVKTMGYASIGIVAGQAIAGMFHNGGEVPREGTYLLDGGETVYTRNQHKQLMNTVENGGNSNSNTSSKQPWNITINEAPPGTSAEVDDEQKTIKIMLGDASRGGEYINYLQQKLGLNSGGYR